MKFYRTLGLALSAALLFAGCSGSASSDSTAQTQTLSAEDQVKEVVNTALQAMHDGDLAGADACMEAGSEGFMNVSQDELSEALASSGLPEGATKSLAELFPIVYQRMVASWEIQSVEVDEEAGTAVALVNLTGADPNAAQEDINAVSMEVTSQWIEENAQEAQTYMEEHTEAEFLTWLFEQVIPLVKDDLLTMEMPEETQLVSFDLVNENGQWKISQTE